jgi:branched-chain amino acid transport system substrate-binding protein
LFSPPAAATARHCSAGGGSLPRLHRRVALDGIFRRNDKSRRHQKARTRAGGDRMPNRYRTALVCAVVALWPLAATAADPIKIGFPIPLSGPTAVYGEPLLKGAEMAVAEINAKGGVLGRKFEILSRDSKANADEAVRLARELIIKNNVDFLVGTLTSAEAPAVSTVAKENKIVFIAPTSKSTILTDPQHINPYIFRVSSNTDVEGLAGATLMARWKSVKTVATIAPDYAYGRDSIAAFIAALKKIRPDIRIVDQEWPKLGEADFTPFITAQMGKKPDAIYSSLFAGDFVTFTKEATPLGYFKAIKNRLLDPAEVGTTDEAQALGTDYPYGIIADAYDPVIWPGHEPAAHKKFIADLKAFTHEKYASGWSIVSYQSIYALAAGIKKAGSTNSDAVAKALAGLTWDTPVGKRSFSVKSHETFAPEYWGMMVKEAAYPFAVMKNPELLPKSFPATN